MSQSQAYGHLMNKDTNLKAFDLGPTKAVKDPGNQKRNQKGMESLSDGGRRGADNDDEDDEEMAQIGTHRQ